MTTSALNKVNVTKLPVLKIRESKKHKNHFELVSITADKNDKDNPAVMQAVSIFREDFDLIKAPDHKKADEQFQNILLDMFTLDKPKKRQAKTTTKTSTKKAETKTATDKKEESKKADKKEEPKKPTPEKALATFQYFLETSKAKCYKLSPDNAKIVKTSLEQFTRYNKLLHSDITADEHKLMTRKDNRQAVDSLLNRNTIRILVTEKDAKNKIVGQYLLKTLYMSPYSILCTVEAHNRDNKKPSIYESIINSKESVMTCYDSFQFDPTNEYLIANADDINKKAKNKISYDFVNIIATSQEEETK